MRSSEIHHEGTGGGGRLANPSSSLVRTPTRYVLPWERHRSRQDDLVTDDAPLDRSLPPAWSEPLLARHSVPAAAASRPLLRLDQGFLVSHRPRRFPVAPSYPSYRRRNDPKTISRETDTRTSVLWRSSSSSSTMAPAVHTRSRTSTMDSATVVPSRASTSASNYAVEGNSNPSSFASLSRQSTRESERHHNGQHVSEPAGMVDVGMASSGQPATAQQTPNLSAQTNNGSTTTAAAPTTSLSGLVCNVHRTTGREPHPLVGASTTILGDKLYVFGGRILSRTRPQLTADLYELDLIRRHWTRIDTKGDIPPPRYFHTVCALGDTKLVCYGGMSPAASHGDGGAASLVPAGQSPAPGVSDAQSEVVVLSDIHLYDVPTRTWTYVPTVDTPQGRYAHCATILPSSGIFTSAVAPFSAIHHNPTSPTGNPNQGSIGVALDGFGGAEMVVVGGQDSKNHYIEQISVFNLRSLQWTATDSLGKSCGAYRSVVTPLTGIAHHQLGKVTGSQRGGGETKEAEQGRRSEDAAHREVGSSMLIYSNYNFLDVKLELQVRLPDGSLIEKPMQGTFSPPGLRFPNGGVIDRHFVVSGTYLTSSKQEYALWALDLRTLTWSRIDAGGNHFSQGSWNRGMLWKRRNMFVVLGNRKRKLVEDYNHRRINFTNICLVELEAFGMYDNPRSDSPMSGFVSASSPSPLAFFRGDDHHHHLPNLQGGGRPLTSAAENLGKLALNLRELADMDFLAIDGERVPVNSSLVARRWGPYFNQLMREGASSGGNSNPPSEVVTADDSSSLRPPGGGQASAPSIASRNSSITITPSIGAASSSSASTIVANSQGGVANHQAGGGMHHRQPSSQHITMDQLSPPTPQNLAPGTRSRTLYLPHTHLTLQTLVHYLYTSSLPPPSHPLCTPQTLCSLLQLARPYRIDGLLEAVVERLHQVLDGRNAAAVFNAAAMAAGGGLATASWSAGRGGLARLNGAGGSSEAYTMHVPIQTTGADNESGSESDTGRQPGTQSSRRHHPQRQRRRRRTMTPTGSEDDEGDMMIAGGGISSLSSSFTTANGNPQQPPPSTNTNNIINTSIHNSNPNNANDSTYPSTTTTNNNTTTTQPQSNYSIHSTYSSNSTTYSSDYDPDPEDFDYDLSDTGLRGEREIWSGEISSVVGLQKRGLRGLMEGRRMRERGRSIPHTSQSTSQQASQAGGGSMAQSGQQNGGGHGYTHAQHGGHTTRNESATTTTASGQATFTLRDYANQLQALNPIGIIPTTTSATGFITSTGFTTTSSTSGAGNATGSGGNVHGSRTGSGSGSVPTPLHADVGNHLLTNGLNPRPPSLISSGVTPTPSLPAGSSFNIVANGGMPANPSSTTSSSSSTEEEAVGGERGLIAGSSSTSAASASSVVAPLASSSASASASSGPVASSVAGTGVGVNDDEDGNNFMAGSDARGSNR